jgi:hypothetical protein
VRTDDRQREGQVLPLMLNCRQEQRRPESNLRYESVLKLNVTEGGDGTDVFVTRPSRQPT